MGHRTVSDTGFFGLIRNFRTFFAHVLAIAVLAPALALPRSIKLERLFYNMLCAWMISRHDAGVSGIPVGIQDISRWLSGATPPVTRRPLPSRPYPGGITDASS